MNFASRMTRRNILLGAGSCIVAGLMPTAGWGDETWPARPITIVVPYAPGGGTDLIARMIGNKMTEQLGQSVLIENREGAGGVVGTSAVARAKADGYTLLFMTTSSVISPPGDAQLPYDMRTDFDPVGQIGASPTLLVVAQESRFQTMTEFIDEAKANPNSVSFGSAGINSFAHLGMEVIASEAQVQLKHIPYRGTAPAIADILAGNLDAALASYASARPLIESGKLRPLVVAGEERLEATPDVPTIVEVGLPNAKIELWWGLAAPANTPVDIVERLNKSLNASLQQDDVRAQLRQEAATPSSGSANDFGKLINSELVRWESIVE